MMSENNYRVKKRNGGTYKCTAHKSASRRGEFEWELQGYFWGNQKW